MYLEYNKDGLVGFKHNMPFDKQFGLGKTKEELEKTGILVETLPTLPPLMDGKLIVLFVNPLRWEYVDDEFANL